MKLLVISNDKKILDPQSAVAKRQIEYAKQYEEVHILLRGRKKELHLGSNVWVYSRLWRYNLARFLIEKRKITHITCQDPFENGLVGVMLKRRTNTHLELQVHTDIGSSYFQNENFKNKIRTYLAKYTFSYADHVRVVSARIKEYVKKYIDESKIEVRPIFVDVEKIKNTPKTETNEKIVLLSVCRLEKEKRVDWIIDAMREIKNAELRIVGDGSQRKYLEKLAEGLPITFYGWQHDTAQFYKNADIFVNTSMYEGYGMTLVEAHAAGLKIISTDVGIAKEVGATIITDSRDIVKHI